LLEGIDWRHPKHTCGAAGEEARKSWAAIDIGHNEQITSGQLCGLLMTMRSAAEPASIDSGEPEAVLWATDEELACGGVARCTLVC